MISDNTFTIILQYNIIIVLVNEKLACLIYLLLITILNDSFALIFGKLIGHIWSGSRQSISLGAELCAAGIDTLFAVDDLVPGMSNYNALVSQELMPENAKYAKLVTIADKNGLDSSANGFSATQYLCYQKDGKLVLAATRKIDSLNVTELKAAQTVTASNGNEYTINKSINSASFIGTDDKTYKTNQINNDFIRYEPK